MLPWSAFTLSLAVIVLAGSRLSRYGDILAEKWGLGRTWVGFILMAAVTSLPELVTGISSVTYAAAPELAVGDVLGSCAFNLLVLALLDVEEPGRTLSSRAGVGHILSGAFGILLLSMAALFLLVGQLLALPALGWVGPGSLAIALVYFVSARIVYAYEKRKIAGFVREMAEELHYESYPERRALAMYAANALAVVAAASALPWAGKEIARSTGLGETFVGTAFLAVATSLPEIVVSVAAVRIGAVDLAIGNLLGSNLFNGLILALDDLFYTPGPLLSSVGPAHAVPALAAAAMTAVAVSGLAYRAERKRLPLAWDSIAMVVLYLLSMGIVYSAR